MTHNITDENIRRQLIRLNSLTDKQYCVVKDDNLLMDDRYTLVEVDTGEEITQHHLIEPFWDCMYSMIRILQHDKDKTRTWEAVVQ